MFPQLFIKENYNYFKTPLEDDGNASPMDVVISVLVDKEREVVSQSKVFAQQDAGAAIQSEVMGLRIQIPAVI